MRLTVDIRAGEVGAFLRTLASDQLPFATALAVNQTALDFQKAQRERLGDIFTIRRPTFILRSIFLGREDRATKTKPEARVRVKSPGGGDRSDIIGKFETDTVKTPFRARAVAVPTKHVPRTAGGVVRRAWRPRRLLEGGRLGTSDRVLPGGGRLVRNQTVRGRRGTFLIRRATGRGTIFQRDGDTVVALYQLVPQVRIEPELEFVKTAERVVEERWAENFTRAFDRAIGLGRRR